MPRSTRVLSAQHYKESAVPSYLAVLVLSQGVFCLNESRLSEFLRGISEL